MSATIEREFEELDAQNRWQQLYLVSPGLFTAGAVFLRGPGLAPANILPPPPTRAQDGSGGAGRVRAAPAPTGLGPF